MNPMGNWLLCLPGSFTAVAYGTKVAGGEALILTRGPLFVTTGFGLALTRQPLAHPTSSGDPHQHSRANNQASAGGIMRGPPVTDGA